MLPYFRIALEAFAYKLQPPFCYRSIRYKNERKVALLNGGLHFSAAIVIAAVAQIFMNYAIQRDALGRVTEQKMQCDIYIISSDSKP